MNEERETGILKAKTVGALVKFKVPSLRNITLTGPYFHDGSQTTLEQAVRKMSWLQPGRELTDTETQSLLAFLGALTDKPRAAAR